LPEFVLILYDYSPDKKIIKVIDMSISLNGYTLPDSTIDKMKRFKRLSNETNERSCFSLCTANQNSHNKNIDIQEKNNIISRSPHKGKICCDIINPKCDPEETPVGIFRANPRQEYVNISYRDLRLAYQHGIVCVASKNEILCYSREGEYDKETNQKILSTIEQDLKLRRVFRELDQHHETVDKYVSTEFIKLNVYKRND